MCVQAKLSPHISASFLTSPLEHLHDISILTCSKLSNWTFLSKLVLPRTPLSPYPSMEALHFQRFMQKTKKQNKIIQTNKKNPHWVILESSHFLFIPNLLGFGLIQMFPESKYVLLPASRQGLCRRLSQAPILSTPVLTLPCLEHSNSLSSCNTWKQTRLLHSSAQPSVNFHCICNPRLYLDIPTPTDSLLYVADPHMGLPPSHPIKSGL